MTIGETIAWNSTDLARGQEIVENRLIEENPGLTGSSANWIARWFS